MAHIHDLIDFTAGAYIVYDGKVLLVDHIKAKTWLPPGGHIELDEDPEEALFREVKEETGLDITILAEKPSETFPGIKFLYPPTYLDIHDFDQNHRHVGMVYFATADTDEVILAESEHNGLRWFTDEELDAPEFAVKSNVKFYARKALERVAAQRG